MVSCERRKPSHPCTVWLRRSLSSQPSISSWLWSSCFCFAASSSRPPESNRTNQRGTPVLKLIIAVFILLSLIIYALMGGADFGGGMWDLLAFGPRAKRQREIIAEAIAPIWEANHVWLILVIVLLFTGFPRGFAAMMTGLNIPMTVMLLGIVLRGSAFVFRKYDVKQRRHWSTVFGMASFLTPFVQGIILGALTTGLIRVE